ncbi:MAG: hypothetical protein LUC97_04180 [Clostridiales bacterium]|nr:hypothetical protein [Clostridiales bacterium]
MGDKELDVVLQAIKALIKTGNQEEAVKIIDDTTAMIDGTDNKKIDDKGL